MAEYIERAIAKEKHCSWCMDTHVCYRGEDCPERKAFDKIPAADVRPVVRGEWVRHVLKNANVPWGYDCSVCGEWFVIGEDTAERYNFCPNCGADMREDDET